MFKGSQEEYLRLMKTEKGKQLGLEVKNLFEQFDEFATTLITNELRSVKTRFCYKKLISGNNSLLKMFSNLLPAQTSGVSKAGNCI